MVGASFHKCTTGVTHHHSRACHRPHRTPSGSRNDLDSSRGSLSRSPLAHACSTSAHSGTQPRRLFYDGPTRLVHETIGTYTAGCVCGAGGSVRV